jgi:hypothetical protein
MSSAVESAREGYWIKASRGSAFRVYVRNAVHAAHALGDALPQRQPGDAILFVNQKHDHPLQRLHLAAAGLADLKQYQHGDYTVPYMVLFDDEPGQKADPEDEAKSSKHTL